MNNEKYEMYVQKYQSLTKVGKHNQGKQGKCEHYLEQVIIFQPHKIVYAQYINFTSNNIT